MENKKGQISIEFLVVIGFVTFIVLGVLGLSFYYINGIQDQIKFNQVDNIGKNIAATADSVFFAGEPSQQTIEVYLPRGVNYIQLFGKEIVFNVSTSSGDFVISYASKADLTGQINSSEGYRRLEIVALTDQVSING